jgi:hypothetical protein
MPQNLSRLLVTRKAGGIPGNCAIIDQKDMRDYKKLAKYYFRLSIEAIEMALKAGKIVEI